jgi:hypothetical protein
VALARSSSRFHDAYSASMVPGAWYASISVSRLTSGLAPMPTTDDIPIMACFSYRPFRG